MYRDSVSRSIFRNYAREFVLSDGSMGVDHVKTRNSNPLHIYDGSLAANVAYDLNMT